MKTIFITISLIFSIPSFAQLLIGTNTSSSASASIEFGTENRGLLLPWVEAEDEVSAEAPLGTMIYDLTDHKVKVKLATAWMDLSIDETGSTVNPLSNVDGALLQANLEDAEGAQVIVGADTTDADGVLVLESTAHAMILPKVASPHDTILNPTPGLMVYDTVSKQLAVFNGSVWTFWSPEAE